MRFVARVKDAVARHGMLACSGPVVTAVSGGPDSMALLEALTLMLGDEAGDTLVVAHLHHGLRESAEGDAGFVRAEAERRGLRFIFGREDVKRIADEEKLSTEAAARKARYAFLERAAREVDAKIVALGHNADDQAETVLLRLFRGAGLRGLGGMRPVRPAGECATAGSSSRAGMSTGNDARTVGQANRGTCLGGMRPVRPAGECATAGSSSRAGMRATTDVRTVGRANRGTCVVYVRPLLGITRAEIVEFLRERNIPFREDETNRDVRFRRNLLRHEIMPAIRERVQPRLTEVLCRLAELAREASDHMEEEAAARIARPRPTSERAAGALSLPRGLWDSLPPALRGPALRILFESASGRSLAHAHVAALRHVADSPQGGEVVLPGGWRARVSPEGIALAEAGLEPEEPEEPVAPWRVDLPVPGRADLPDGRVITAELRRREPDERPPRAPVPSAVGARHAVPLQLDEWADYDAIGRPERLVVRSREPGDEFRPLGSSPTGGPPGETTGRRSVKRFLIDIKVPREERARVPVVTTPDGRLVWLAPHRLDDRARVTDGTREVLVLKLSRAPRRAE